MQTGVDEVGTRGQIGQKPKNNMAACGVVKVLVSFYRSGDDSPFERHRSRVTFDFAKQSSVAAVKKHLTEFLGLSELALKFGMKRVFIFDGITEIGSYTSYKCKFSKERITSVIFVEHLMVNNIPCYDIN